MHLRFTLNRPSLVVALVFQSLLYKHEYKFMFSYQPHTMMLQQRTEAVSMNMSFTIWPRGIRRLDWKAQNSMIGKLRYGE